MSNLIVKFLIPPDDSIADAMYVRTKVFQEEQGIDKKLDFDGNDDSSTHILIYDGKNPIGTGRIRKIDDETVKIERVAVLSEMRSHGVGKLIMKSINDYLSKTKVMRITLDAQLHAKGFYEGLGYKHEGEIFEEVGIPHVVMVKIFD